MIERFDLLNGGDASAALARPRGREDAALLARVREIVTAVRGGGWDALANLALAIDGAAPERIAVAPVAARARASVDAATLDALELAAGNIATFHAATRPERIEVIPYPGLSVAKEWRPLRRAGLYVPGGKAPLFSTLLMLALPARAAGVQDIVVVTPPRPGGGLDPMIALAAERCGIDAVWTVGGAQAIAALAFGAGDIPAVDRICGPGNAWVAAAKALVAAMPGGPGIDLPAGPSELMVIAGAGADAATVAADLLSQAEHDREAQALCLSDDAGLLEAIAREVEAQAAAMGGDYAPVRLIRCASLDAAATLANAYAPEHLSLACGAAEALLPTLTSAGAIFVGAQAAESFGDYLAGSSHVLPTDGAARYTGGITTMSFMKAITVQRIGPRAAAALAAPAAALARAEGLEAHARAAEARAARAGA